MTSRPASVDLANGHPELVLAMLADARLPNGAHTQSNGLEPALAAGMAVEEIPAYLDARLRTVVRVEAGTAVVARWVLLAGGPLDGVLAAWAARTPSAALREACRQQGRGYLRMARQLWDGSPVWGELPSAPARPVVLGAIAAVAGLDAAQLVRLVGYDDVQTVVTASLKLRPMDPATPARWALATHPRIAELALELAGLEEPHQVPASGAPLIEQWAEEHAQTRMRLFSA